MATSNVVPIDPGVGSYRKRDDVPRAEDATNVTIAMPDTGGPAFDPNSGTTSIDLPDGSVTIAFGSIERAKESKDFDDNLAEYLSESELSAIAEKLLLGIEQDEQSRSAWLENMSNALGLLGLEIRNPRGAAVAAATPAEGTSNVDHPLLLEAVLRFQANARGELLPSDGPVKVRNDGEGNALAEMLAQALEKDLNHYLTKVAKEYYPDTDRMLLQLGFCGISFKKGYHDAIKRRPVIASIDAKDLIVSNAATDIDGAGRVTHRIIMRPSMIKRMMIVGAYRTVELALTGTSDMLKNPVDQKIDQIQGIAPPTYTEPDDKDRELFECYCEIEVPGFEHKYNGEETGLPLPYKVVLDKDSRRVLEIRRNWHEDDPLCLPRNRIIAYIFIPGLGFYGIGLLNVLGNATKAVTAAWRLMIDAGMFSNFPGFLYIKSLAKQLTNQFRVPPGSGVPIDTMGQDIRASVLPLPYKDPSAVFIQLIDNIATTAQRVGGTAELQIGEGKQDAPVGTTLAMIEQATKLMSAVHKRLHQAQGQEFDMLKSLLMEDPEALWRHNPKKSQVLKLLMQQHGLSNAEAAEEQAAERHKQLFLTALADLELAPAADPNTSSQTERYLKVVALRQMSMTNQSIDINKVDERAMRTMGIDDPQSFFRPPPPPGTQQPGPEETAANATMIEANARMIDAQTKMKDASTKAQNVQMQSAAKQQELEGKNKIAALGVARELVIHNADTKAAAHELELDSAHRTADRIAQLHGTALGLQAQQHNNSVTQGSSMFQQRADHRHEHLQKGLDRLHQMNLAQAKQGVAGNGDQGS